ncbi:MAG: cyclic nucleotide-binding domain-containing protein [Thermoguttaceae bacterium]|nr:cyclic nucleotide-binding domain-containing protein [Thermoguttaceae bacterium]MBO7722459.1 cyclic nucleotide-binding domain-containing protein [Thermoguttaceae bacterium]MBQ2683659.1 cyclic nucleotide-binding domain-containing protein [Thermoguttaceae bacterium]MBQ3454320.1 cyclic nucleotide-binding domain-containing protein [Thermoguttaceae bacterium]MBQ6620448.1 cyclic nucleotide-binding domain-containing protein [Thermoguttaceae bacterium]
MSPIVTTLTRFMNIPDVNPETLAKIEKICELKHYAANDIVYREHEESQHLFVVVSGQVDVQYLLKDGRRLTLDSCTEGDYLLWSSVIPPHKTNSIGICRVATELLSVDGKELLRICDEDPSFGYKMMSLVATVIRRRLQASRQQLSYYAR